MAADMSGGGSPDPWSWSNIVGASGAVLAAIGLPGLLVRVMDHFSGRHKSEAEAEKTEAEAEALRENHGAEFERAVNDRVKTVLDSWEKQVGLLTARITAQQDEIGELRNEVVELRKALDATTKALHLARGAQGFGQ